MSGYASFSSKYPPLYKSFVGKRATAKERVIQALPVGTSSGQRHISTFTGRAIEVEDNESIRDLHENGCFGIRASSRATARSLRKDVDGSATEKLLLFPEEAFFLCYSLNCLEIRRKDGSQMKHEECLVEFTKIHPQFITSFVVYTYLRSKNWVIKSGIKFGGDFCKKIILKSLRSLTHLPVFPVAYRRGPEFFHATYLVFVRSGDEPPVDPVQLQSIHRVAQTSGKEVLFLQVTPEPSTDSYSDYLRDKFASFRVTEVIPTRFILK